MTYFARLKRPATVVALSLLALVLATQTASAAQSTDLIRHVPSDARFVMGVDVDKVKDSVLFDEFLQALEDAQGQSGVLAFALEGRAFDFEEDIDHLAITLDNPTQVANPQQPAAQDSATVFRGKLDQKQVIAAAKKKFGELQKRKVGKLAVHTAGSIEFAFPTGSTLVVADKGAFGDRVWAAAGDVKKSAKSNKELNALLGLVNTKRGVWVAARTKGLPQGGGPQMDGAAISANVRNGLAINLKSDMASEEDAKQAVKDAAQMKKESAQNPFVTMLGVKPLLDNLKTSRQGEIVDMKTSMTKTQVEQMIKQLKAMQQQQAPVAPSGQRPGPTEKPEKPADVDRKEGAEADFN